MLQKKPDFRLNRMRKSGKTEFFEVHIERAVITQSENSVVRHISHFLPTCAHAQLQIELSPSMLLKFLCFVVHFSGQSVTSCHSEFFDRDPNGIFDCSGQSEIFKRPVKLN